MGISRYEPSSKGGMNSLPKPGTPPAPKSFASANIAACSELGTARAQLRTAEAAAPEPPELIPPGAGGRLAIVSAIDNFQNDVFRTTAYVTWSLAESGREEVALHLGLRYLSSHLDEAIDSYNLLPVLSGEDYERPLRTATVQNTSPNKFALRQGDWVLIDAPSGAAKKEPKSYLKHFGLDPYGKGHSGLLFNLKEDPRQSNNLYAKHPDMVASMRRLLKRYIAGERCAPAR